ncbi:hypothetical protein JCM17960_27650 [Magnetospira thiophila]
MTLFRVVMNGILAACWADVICSPALALDITVYTPPLVQVETQVYQPSNCVGKPVTPLCALDSWRVCLGRQRPDICATIGLVDMVFRKSQDAEALFDTGFVRENVVLKSLRLTADDLAKPSAPTWARVGDVGIEWESRSCSKDGIPFRDCQPKHPNYREIIYFRQFENRWQVVAWTNDAGWEFSCESAVEPYGRECRLYVDEAPH